MSETEKNEAGAVAIAREGLTHTHGTFADPEVREAARASMPEVVADAVRYVADYGGLLCDREVEFARALIAAHEREVVKDATIAHYRRHFRGDHGTNCAGHVVGGECSCGWTTPEEVAEIAELRAALGEACDLAGYGLQSTTDAGRLDAWRRLAEGGK